MSNMGVGGVRTMVFRELRIEELIVRKHIHTACLFVLALVASGATLVHLRSVRPLPSCPSVECCAPAPSCSAQPASALRVPSARGMRMT